MCAGIIPHCLKRSFTFLVWSTLPSPISFSEISANDIFVTVAIVVKYSLFAN